MPDARDIFGIVFKNGSATLLARIVDGGGNPLVRAEVASIRYSVCLLDPNSPDRQIPVAGHGGASLSVADTIYDVLQTDAVWTCDGVGYNFKHVLDVSSHQAFPTAGRRYRIVYEFVPTSGQVILARFEVRAI